MMNLLGIPMTMDDFVQKFAITSRFKTIFTSAVYQMADLAAYFGGLFLAALGISNHDRVLKHRFDFAEVANDAWIAGLTLQHVAGHHQ